MKYLMTVTNNKVMTFEPGVPTRVLVVDTEGRYEMTLVTGRVKFADGSEWPAVLGIDEASFGERWETYIMFGEGGLLEPSSEITRKIMGKTYDQIFPYKYNYQPVQLGCCDHHVDEDTGWSK